MALRLGVAHPPGYPLWTLLAHLFGALPLGNPCWQIALLSAVATGVAVGLVFRALRLLGTGRPAALLGVVPFALAATTVRVAGIPEVFALNLALVAALLTASAGALRAGGLTVRRALALGLVAGLGASNHHTLVLIAPVPLAVFLALGRRELRWWVSRLGAGLGGLMLGLLPYAYLVVAGAGDGWPRWGEPHTLAGFVAHVTRADYGTFALGLWTSADAPPPHAWAHLVRTFFDLGPAAVLLGLAGLAYVVRTRTRPTRVLGLGALAAWLLCGPAFHALFNLPDTPAAVEIAARFDVMPHLVLTLLMGLGATWLVERLPSRTRLRGALLAALTVAAAAPGFLALPDAAPRRHVLTERYGRDLLRPLPPGAVLLIDGDAEFSALTWLQEVGAVRPDVGVLHLGLLGHRWYVEAMRRRTPALDLPFTPGEARAREIVESAHRAGIALFGSMAVASRLAARWAVVPFGLGVQVLAPGSRPPTTAALEAIQRALTEDVARRTWPRVEPTATEARVLEAYGAGWSQLALAYDAAGQRGLAARARTAAAALRAILRGTPPPS